MSYHRSTLAQPNNAPVNHVCVYSVVTRLTCCLHSLFAYAVVLVAVCKHNTARIRQTYKKGKQWCQHALWQCLTYCWVLADLASKASEYTEDAVAVAVVLGLAAGAYYAVTVLKKQRSKELEEAEEALRQERELASRSPVRRVQRLVQRLKGNA